MTKHLNPLPCGCAMMGTPKLTPSDPMYLVHLDQHIVFCPMHKAAPDLLAALKEVRQAYNLRDAVQSLDALAALVPQIDAAIQKAEGR